MNPKLKSIFQFIVFLFIGLALLYLLYHQLDLAYQKECAFKDIPEDECSLMNRILTDFRSVKIFWILVVCIAFMISNWLRAVRWNQLLEPLGYKPKILNSLGCIMIAYLSNMALPRIGEVVRAGTLSRYENIPVSKVFGTVVVDRILDVLSLLLVIGLALLLSFTTFQDYFAENFQMPAENLLYILLAGFVIGMIGLFIINRLLQSDTITNPFLSRIAKLWHGFKDGLISIKSVGNVPLLISNSIGIWLMYYLMTYLCFFAFTPTQDLSPVAALVVFVFGSLGMVLPSPGGIGSYQWLVSQALIIYGIDKFDAFSFSNIMFFTIQIGCNILFGFFFLMFLPQYNSKETSQAPKL